MKIRYNAPVTLTFALISTGILIMDLVFRTQLIPSLFSVPGKGQFSFAFLPGYIRLFTHVIGHKDWSHLLSNFAFILLLGPILEEKYSSPSLFFMILITALVTGFLNVMLSNYGLMGASGIVFMMILLISFANIKNGDIPVTFILIVVIFLLKEILAAISRDSISQFAHIIGGICGSLFGFFKTR